MRRMMTRTVGALVFMLGAAGTLAAQTADDLVAKNLKAKGGVDKLKAVQGMRVTGRLTVPGASSGAMEVPMTILKKRPNRLRQESSFQGQSVILAYDGATAWVLNPMMGAAQPQQIQGDRLEMVKMQADFDGPLVDYKAKGTIIELVGTEMQDGKKVHKLKLTSKSGPAVYFYLDDATGLESKAVMEVPTEPNAPPGTPPGTLEVLFSNYQSVEGLVLPFSIQQKAGGQVLQVTIDKVELSPPVDDTVFSMPAPVAPPAPK
jgi:outer membrane lipoprotein-sorting protein